MFETTFCKTYQSPLGAMILNSDGESLTALCFVTSEDYKKCTPDSAEKDLPIFDQTTRWLDIYFQGKNPQFTPKYKIHNLTPFRQAVINEMLKIPYGQTTTYGAIAGAIAQQRDTTQSESAARRKGAAQSEGVAQQKGVTQQKGAAQQKGVAQSESVAWDKGTARMSAQAVGGAVGWNPICLIIPCHRVVGASGNLTGYGGGIDRKIKLLELEGVDVEKYFIPGAR